MHNYSFLKYKSNFKYIIRIIQDTRMLDWFLKQNYSCWKCKSSFKSTISIVQAARMLK